MLSHNFPEACQFLSHAFRISSLSSSQTSLNVAICVFGVPVNCLIAFVINCRHWFLWWSPPSPRCLRFLLLPSLRISAGVRKRRTYCNFHCTLLQLLQFNWSQYMFGIWHNIKRKCFAVQCKVAIPALFRMCGEPLKSAQFRTCFIVLCPFLMFPKADCFDSSPEILLVFLFLLQFSESLHHSSSSRRGHIPVIGQRHFSKKFNWQYWGVDFRSIFRNKRVPPNLSTCSAQYPNRNFSNCTQYLGTVFRNTLSNFCTVVK